MSPRSFHSDQYDLYDHVANVGAMSKKIFLGPGLYLCMFHV